MVSYLTVHFHHPHDDGEKYPHRTWASLRKESTYTSTIRLFRCIADPSSRSSTRPGRSPPGLHLLPFVPRSPQGQFPELTDPTVGSKGSFAAPVWTMPWCTVAVVHTAVAVAGDDYDADGIGDFFDAGTLTKRRTRMYYQGTSPTIPPLPLPPLHHHHVYRTAVLVPPSLCRGATKTHPLDAAALSEAAEND